MNDEFQEPEIFKIPHHEEPRITHETFCKLYNDKAKYNDFIIVDCRSAAEYEGGHIKGSIRWHPKDQVFTVEDLHKKIWKPKSLYIFHCEYSEYRGPIAWEKFKYAHSFSPNFREPLHAYVLDGGYKQFYQLHPEYCEGEYVSERSTVT